MSDPTRAKLLARDAEAAGYTVDVAFSDAGDVTVRVDVDETDWFSLSWRRTRTGTYRLVHSTDGWSERLPLAEVRYRLGLDR